MTSRRTFIVSFMRAARSLTYRTTWRMRRIRRIGAPVFSANIILMMGLNPFTQPLLYSKGSTASLRPRGPHARDSPGLCVMSMTRMLLRFYRSIASPAQAFAARTLAVRCVLRHRGRLRASSTVISTLRRPRFLSSTLHLPPRGSRPWGRRLLPPLRRA